VALRHCLHCRIVQFIRDVVAQPQGCKYLSTVTYLQHAQNRGVHGLSEPRKTRLIIRASTETRNEHCVATSGERGFDAVSLAVLVQLLLNVNRSGNSSSSSKSHFRCPLAFALKLVAPAISVSSGCGRVFSGAAFRFFVVDPEECVAGASSDIRGATPIPILNDARQGRASVVVAPVDGLGVGSFPEERVGDR